MENGSLFSSGLIAGGSLIGIVIAVLLGTMITNSDGTSSSLMEKINTQIGEHLGSSGDLLALGCFLIMGALLFKFAVKEDNKAL